MYWRNSVRCPKCGSKSEVSTGRPPDRYRTCLNARCRFHWRTVEVLCAQADEMSTWYTAHVEQKGHGWAALNEAVSEIYDRAVALGLMLGVVKEVDGETISSSGSGNGSRGGQ